MKNELLSKILENHKNVYFNETGHVIPYHTVANEDIKLSNTELKRKLEHLRLEFHKASHSGKSQDIIDFLRDFLIFYRQAFQKSYPEKDKILEVIKSYYNNMTPSA